MYQNTYLAHYGIKGMRWGVRRYQNKDGSLTPAGKEHAKTLKSYGMEKIRDNDNLKISKNTKMYRISKTGKENTDTRYVSYRENDRAFYKGYWGSGLREDDPFTDIYEQKYRLKDDIFIPSAKTRRKILSDLLNDDDVVKSLYGDEFNDKSLKSFRFATKTWGDAQRANYLSKFMGTNPDILAKYGEQIVSRGFNAVIDDNGRCVGEMPVILFTSNTSLVQKGAKMLDDDDEILSRGIYSDVKAKKYRSKTASLL